MGVLCHLLHTLKGTRLRTKARDVAVPTDLVEDFCDFAFFGTELFNLSVEPADAFAHLRNFIQHGIGQFEKLPVNPEPFPYPID